MSWKVTFALLSVRFARKLLRTERTACSKTAMERMSWYCNAKFLKNKLTAYLLIPVLLTA
jgi:hypothetical protein